MGNTFIGNWMHSNGAHTGGPDALDFSFTTVDSDITVNNAWPGNRPDTDAPTDTICVN